MANPSIIPGAYWTFPEFGTYNTCKRTFAMGMYYFVSSSLVADDPTFAWAGPGADPNGASSDLDVANHGGTHTWARQMSTPPARSYDSGFYASGADFKSGPGAAIFPFGRPWVDIGLAGSTSSPGARSILQSGQLLKSALTPASTTGEAGLNYSGPDGREYAGFAALYMMLRADPTALKHPDGSTLSINLDNLQGEWLSRYQALQAEEAAGEWPEHYAAVTILREVELAWRLAQLCLSTAPMGYETELGLYKNFSNLHVYLHAGTAERESWNTTCPAPYLFKDIAAANFIFRDADSWPIDKNMWEFPTNGYVDHFIDPEGFPHMGGPVRPGTSAPGCGGGQGQAWIQSDYGQGAQKYRQSIRDGSHEPRDNADWGKVFVSVHALGQHECILDCEYNPCLGMFKFIQTSNDYEFISPFPTYPESPYGVRVLNKHAGRSSWQTPVTTAAKADLLEMWSRDKTLGKLGTTDKSWGANIHNTRPGEEADQNSWTLTGDLIASEAMQSAMHAVAMHFRDKNEAAGDTGYLEWVINIVWKRINELFGLLGEAGVAEFIDAARELASDEFAQSGVKSEAELGRVGAEAVQFEAREAATAFDQQCYLMENIRALTYSTAGRKWGRIGIIDGKPGNLATRLNHGGSAQNEPTRRFLNLTPEEHALLTPHLKLSRVVYDDGDPPKVMAEQPLPFESYTTYDDIQKIFKGTVGRQVGAGIKSFTWTLQGVQPEEVDNNITATLVVHFQSLNDLFKNNLVEIDDNKPPAYYAGAPEAGFLDLIIAPETVKGIKDKLIGNEDEQESSCVTTSRIYRGHNYCIKAEVGWAVPTGLENLPGMQDAQALAEALNQQKKVLFLQLGRHNLDFNQDGSVTLTVDYHARLDGIMKSQRADIFASEKAISYEQSKQEFEDVVAQRDAAEAAGQPDEKLNEKVEGLSDELVQLERMDKAQKYQNVLRVMFEEGTMYSIRVPMTELLKPAWGDLDEEQRAKRARSRQSNPRFEFAGSVNDSDIPLVDAAAEIRAGALAGGEQDPWANDGENWQNLGQKINRIADATPADTVDIFYFYFGDLVQSVLGLPHIAKLVETKELALALGTVELLDPLVAYQIENLPQISRCGQLRSPQILDSIAHAYPLGNLPRTGVFEHFDLASVPISLDAFSEWFLQNVIKPGRDRYYLLHFIKDVLSSLVSYAMSPSCFSGIPNTPIRFATTSVFVKGTKTLVGKRLSVEQLIDGDYIATRGNLPNFKPRPPYHVTDTPTMIIYSTDSRPQGFRNGRFEDSEELGPGDLSEGIYHFYLGASAGLVKNISYSRMDQPYLREAKIQRYGTLGAEQLRELYSAKLTLVGNVLLKNGMFIYINPSAIGTGTASAEGTIPNLARLLGLGGYFLVTSVTSTVSAEGFTTEVEALHQDVPSDDPGTAGVTIIPPDGVPEIGGGGGGDDYYGGGGSTTTDEYDSGGAVSNAPAATAPPDEEDKFPDVDYDRTPERPIGPFQEGYHPVFDAITNTWSVQYTEPEQQSHELVTGVFIMSEEVDSMLISAGVSPQEISDMIALGYTEQDMLVQHGLVAPASGAPSTYFGWGDES